MEKAKNVLIIGGGIVGCSCAYYLHKAGHQVTIIDKTGMQSGASYVNAGFLTPSHIIPLASPGMINQGLRYMFNSTSPFYMKPRWDTDFFKWAWYFKKSSTAKKVAKAIPAIKDSNLLSHELFTEILNSEDLGKFQLEKSGLLMLYKNPVYGEKEGKTAKIAKELGLAVEHLDEKSLAQIEPEIQLNAVGAYHYHCDAQTTPTEFMSKMVDYLDRSGVSIMKNKTVQGFTRQNGHLKGIRSESGHHEFDEFVLAAGSWSKNLASQLEIKLPLVAGKGYRIDVPEPTGIKMPAIVLDTKVAISPMKGFTRFAGTMEFSGVNHKIRRERVEAIAKGAEGYYQGLQINEKHKEQAQCGLRPVTPDGMPYIGRTSTWANLTIATGHAMMGWSMGPVTGKLVSEIISKQKPSLDISPYAPERRFR